ncbi:S1/P1 nuclease [Niveibacterium sp. SC-1]|uniref:S1/P1 nuclease n=1 Tax=Niveibacterium sp. SC-1 TaxID=3135646 RepID=UPI00311EF561
MRKPRTARVLRQLLPLLFCGVTHLAQAWGPVGHESVGAIADRLLAGSRASHEIAALLDGWPLAQAAVWADCAKGVDPAKDYSYTARGRFAECAPFETDAGITEMVDFVRRNDDNCARKPGEESCHKQYHYADVAIQRRSYAAGHVGRRDDDVVAASAAMIRVLQGRTAPAPFVIRDKREALLLLAHYLGDLHQPLHVGAIYLDAAGHPVDPDTAGFDPDSATRGGNQLVLPEGRGNLHHLWDDVAEADDAAHIDAAWLKQARRVARTRGAPADWPAAWTGGSLSAARAAFADLSFAAKQGASWRAAAPEDYEHKLRRTQHRQLTLAGARLAQTLRAVWP